MKITQCLLIFVLLGVSLGSDCGRAADTIEFDIRTMETQFDSHHRPFSFNISGVEVSGVHVQDRSDLGVVKGNGTAWDYTSHGIDYCIGCRAAANWKWVEHNGPCAGQFITFAVKQHDIQPLDCDETGTIPLRAPFSPDPASIDLESPPAIVTVNGGGMDTTYGMPVVDFYDENGTLVARTTAHEVGWDGTMLRVYTPDLSSAQTGSFVLFVSNVTADGSLSEIGVLGIGVYTPEPPPPPPPDPDPCEPYCQIY